MDGGNINCSYVNIQTRPYHDRRCKNKKEMLLETKFDSLPDDVVFDILVRIPAQDIYNAARLVCRKWYHMINSPNFIGSHLRRSTPRLLVHFLPRDRKYSTPVAMRKVPIEISMFSKDLTKFIWSSCNGLVLEPRTDQYDIYVTNPATKRSFALPQFVPRSPVWCNTLAYAPMLTLGVDQSWRHLLITQHLSQTATELLRYTPLTSEGFFHWARKGTSVLTLNVETETFTLNPFPECRGETLEYYYLSAGRFLSLLIARTKFSWEVWEMKPESGEWKKMGKIDLEAQRTTFNNVLCYDLFKPVGWLIYGEVLVFNAYFGLFYGCPESTRDCFAYYVCRKGIESFELESDRNIFVFHRDSLVWPNGC